jgi:hypothetical protein
MTMGPAGLEGLKQALGSCRKAAAVVGGFCDVASWPAKLVGWPAGLAPSRGRGVLGANRRVGPHRADARAEGI